MRSAPLRYCSVIVQLILLSACAPQATPSPTPPPSLPVVSIDLAGPKMEVGSTFLYADGTVLVAVPGGIFTMGDGGPDNAVHKVNVSDFWIYSTKVTNGQFAYCVAMGLCTPPLRADNAEFDDTLHANDPMVGVTYDQATAYCSFAHARPPTEAEWEKTARGPNGNIYPWGDGAPSCDLLNYGICVGNTTPVTTYPTGRSYYHAFDMEGNAQEWVADKYQADYYPIAPPDNPTGPEKGRERVIRSSAFNSGGDQTEAFNRFHSSPETHRDNLGFRCVVDDPTYFAPFCNYPATYGTDGIGGAPTGEQSIVDCPDLSIQQDPTCIGTQPVTHVTFPHGAGINQPGIDPYLAPGCQVMQHPWEYDCTGNGQLRVCAGCNVTLTSQPQCPDGYPYDAGTNTCGGHGGTGACLPGFTLGEADAAGQCCAFEPGNALNLICGYIPNTQILTCNLPFASCPAGAFFDGHDCISVQVQGLCKTVGVSLKSCTSGGGGCPEQSCEQNYAWDPNTCSCVCTPSLSFGC